MNILRLSKTALEIRRSPLPDGAILEFLRAGRVQDTLRLGPNQVHAGVTHADGSYTDYGISENLLCTDGRDLIAASMGAAMVASNTATAVTATSLTDSGETWTVNAYKGWTVWCDTAAGPVFANIGSNSATVLTVDDWQSADGTSATDPTGTPVYSIMPSCRPIYMGITAEASAASAASTVLTTEQTANGLARVKCTYAHSDDAATFTLAAAWTATGTVASLHRIGLFTAANTTAAGVLVFESVLNADVSVVADDNISVTDTVTLS